MSASPPPPPYSESEEPLPSPSYSSEQPTASSSHTQANSSTFPVGLHDLHDPLVQIKHLKLHLRFLGAMHDLRRRVESINEASWSPLISELDGEQRWSWFVNLAVERQVPMRSALINTSSHGLESVVRFQRWVECLSPPLKQNTFARFVRNDMPPIDVWMVLHAYLLNPQSVSSLLENSQSDFMYSIKVLRRGLHPPSIPKTSCNAHGFTS